MLKRTLFILSLAAGITTFAGQNQMLNANGIEAPFANNQEIPNNILKKVLKLSAVEFGIPYPDAVSAHSRGILTVEQPDPTTNIFRVTFGGGGIWIILEDI